MKNHNSKSRNPIMTISVSEAQYIFPPRPVGAVPRNDVTIFTDAGWQPQLKYNDSRCEIKYCADGNIELWNRHAERFRSYCMPDWLGEQLETVRGVLNLQKDKYHLLDGGLLDQKHRALSDTIVIWDILVEEGNHLIGTTYQERYRRLLVHAGDRTFWYESKHHDPIDFGIWLTDNVLLARFYQTTDVDHLWDVVDTINAPFTIGKPNDQNYSIKPLLEGLVLKDAQGKLELGYKEKNNHEWQARSRVHTGRHAF